MAAPSVLGLISHKVFPAQMGGQKCIAGFYAHLSKRVPVILAASRENKDSSENPYPVLPFLYNHWWGFMNLFRLYRLHKLIREKKITVLIVELSYFGWLGLLLRRITKVPVIIHSHNIESLRFKDLQKSWWRLYELYEKRIHRKANHSFFITEEDRNWAISHWQLPPSTCSVITYGTELTEPSKFEEKESYRNQLLAEYSLEASTRLFYFNGSLDYLPNTDALRIILNELIPLLHSVDFRFRIFVSGANLSDQWKQALAGYPEIIYIGFSSNPKKFYIGADCFINPVTLGAGIKTKLVEALAYNQASISTKAGAKGIDANMIGGRLFLVDDYDWYRFAAAMVKMDLSKIGNTSADFYKEFNWDNIIQKALISLQSYV